jgi:PfaB family protein
MKGKIAIVGASCLFPGADSLDQFWENLILKKSSIVPGNANDFGVDPVDVLDTKKAADDRINAIRGGFIRDVNIDSTGYNHFNTETFQQLDREFKWSLYVAKNAINNANITPETLHKTKAGIIMGNVCFPKVNESIFFDQIHNHILDEALGKAPDFELKHKHLIDQMDYTASSVIKLGLGLNGVAFDVDAACAGSLYAIKVAIDMLQLGQADLMLAGAVTASNSYFIHAGFTIFQALAPEDKPYAPLDNRSTGLAAAQGAGMVVLKRLDDAIAANDNILGVIAGISLTNDGGGKFILSPNEEGQQMAYDEALAQNNLNIADTYYIECHATGTAQGDSTELKALYNFFGKNGCNPKVGAVKSNIGHLLAASGMASLFKILGSFKHNQIPATIGIEQPLLYENKTSTHIVTENAPWLNRTKQAGINAFGFGGTNAHMVLQNYQLQKSNSKAVKKITATPIEMAIVGMDAHFGTLTTLQEFKEAIFENKQVYTTLPKQRWKQFERYSKILEAVGINANALPKANYITAIAADLLYFKIPPIEFGFLEPQQLLILKVIDNALRNANIKPAGKTAVIIAMKIEKKIFQFNGRWRVEQKIKNDNPQSPLKVNIEKLAALKNLFYAKAKTTLPSHHTSIVGNLMASRVASLWNFKGPAFTITSQDDAVKDCLLTAHNLLATHQVDAVVVGAVDLCGGYEETLLRAATGNINVTENSSIFLAEGYKNNFIGEGAGAIVLKNAKEITTQERVYSVIEQIHNTPVLSGTYIEIASKNISTEIFKKTNQQQATIGSVQTNIGNTQVSNTMASIIKMSLCIYHKILAGIPNWTAPADKQVFAQTQYYFLSKSIPWVINKKLETRKATILSTAGSILLKDANYKDDIKQPVFKQQLIIVTGSNQQELETALETLSIELDKHKSLKSLAYTYFKNANLQHTFKIVFVAKSIKHVATELNVFKANLAKAIAQQKPIHTPSGSYFTPTPIGNAGKLAFVYPGSATIYENIGSDLFETFPTSINDLEEIIKFIPSIKEYLNYIYPKTIDVNTKPSAIHQNAMAMMGLGICYATIFTKLLQRNFNIQPNVAMGYSMGECSTMYYALGIWNANKPPHFEQSDVFKTKFTGELTTLANYWNITPAQAKKEWVSIVLLTSANVVRPLIAATEKVYLSFINTDKEVIISGQKDACMSIVKKCNADYVVFPFQNIIHHPFCEVERKELYKIHYNTISENKYNITFYSSITQQPIPLNTKDIANNSTAVCINPVDFTKQVKHAYAQGVQYFVEVGPNNTCTNWTQDILTDKPILAVPTDKKNAATSTNILSLVAQLISNGKTLTIDWLFNQEQETTSKNTLVKKLVVGLENCVEDVGVTLHENKVTTMPQNIIPKQTIPQFAENGLEIYDFETGEHLKNKSIVFSQQDLETFATGNIANVFGKAYAIIDTYQRRVMLPMYPYLLVSRVTAINAKINEYKPSTMQTEYDIPKNAWYSVDGQIATAVCVESGQCDLLLISYLGIDFQNKGEYVYRLLDCTLTFMDDLPFEGQTLRYDISINNFVKNENNLLFFFSYECFVGDRMILKMDGGCAGFFRDDQLAVGAGVVYTKAELLAMQHAEKQYFVPLITTHKTSFTKQHLLALSKGLTQECFEDEAYFNDGRNRSLKLSDEKIMMIDRIVSVNRTGGCYGLGEIIAEKDLHPDDWYFPCHFRDDQVLAGSLQAEGGSTLLKFFMLYLGMQKLTKDARFQPIAGVRQRVRCRKQVVPNVDTKLVYKLVIKQISLLPMPMMIGDLEIISDGIITVHFENLGLQLREKNNPAYLNQAPPSWKLNASKTVLMNERNIATFALGKLANAFGNEFAPLDNKTTSRQPNTDLQMISRVISITGERQKFNTPSHIVTEYDIPIDAWYYVQNANKTLPYSILMEIALQPCGLLGAYLGSTLPFSNTELFFRNLDGSGHYINEALPETFLEKTIINRSTLVSSTVLGDVIIQKYSFALYYDDQLFYEGNSAFGYFTKAALSSQLGLDNGTYIAPWYETNTITSTQYFRFKLDSLYAKTHLYKNQQSKPHYTLSTNQLNFINEGLLMNQGGQYNMGYVFATKRIKTYEWFFYCHFYQDPVMPGSLGVEAMLQALQVYIIQQKIGAQCINPSFVHSSNHKTIWKYRGQILQHVKEMKLELHIKQIETQGNATIVVADGYIWNDTVRIYQVTNLSITIKEA